MSEPITTENGDILRWVKLSDYLELVNLYHLAKASGFITKHSRMVWASEQFAKTHPYLSATAAYKDLSANLEGY